MLPYSFSDLVANIIRTHSAADDQPDRCAIEQSDQEPIVQPDFFADQLGPNNVPDGIRSECLTSVLRTVRKPVERTFVDADDRDL